MFSFTPPAFLKIIYFFCDVQIFYFNCYNKVLFLKNVFFIQIFLHVAFTWYVSNSSCWTLIGVDTERLIWSIAKIHTEKNQFWSLGTNLPLKANHMDSFFHMDGTLFTWFLWLGIELMVSLFDFINFYKKCGVLFFWYVSCGQRAFYYFF